MLRFCRLNAVTRVFLPGLPESGIMIDRINEESGGYMAQELVVLIDGSSLVHRAFYALPPLMTKSGLETGAVHGFMNMLLRLLEEQQPSVVAVAFDKSRITFRNAMYDGYKAQRKPTPPELSGQFPLVMELLTAMGIPALELNGYEADDIIGTLAVRYAAEQKRVLVVTGDRDQLQLIRNGISVLLTKKGISDLDLYDEAQFFERYQLQPLQLIDLKGLMGDASDNIPGVPGVGEKTALKLLYEYGSVESVLADAQTIKGKLGEKLRENAELALLSKQLATIDLNVPLKREQEASTPDLQREALQKLCSDLELRAVWARLEKKFPDAPKQEELVCMPESETIKDIAVVEKLIGRRIEGEPFVCLAETEGKDADTVFLALNFLIDGRAVRVETQSAAWHPVAALLASAATPKWTHDAKGLLHACNRLDIVCANLAFDAAVAAYLLDAGADADLPKLVEMYTPDMVGRHPVCQLAALQPVLWQLLTEREQLTLYRDIELPLVPVLVELEETGIALAMDEVEALRREIGGRIETLAAEITELAGEPDRKSVV